MYANWRSSWGRIGEGVRGLEEDELVRDWMSYTASIGGSRAKSKLEGTRQERERGQRGTQGSEGGGGADS